MHADGTPRGPELGKLEAYALRRLGASRYPDASHRFRSIACPNCGASPLRLSVEHHSGSKQGRFRGRLEARCEVCGQTWRAYSFTGEHRTLERTTTPICRCGGTSFYVAECERVESDEGLPGFVDEGVVVAQCATCGRHHSIVETD